MLGGYRQPVPLDMHCGQPGRQRPGVWAGDVYFKLFSQLFNHKQQTPLGAAYIAFNVCNEYSSHQDDFELINPVCHKQFFLSCKTLILFSIINLFIRRSKSVLC